MNMTKAEKVIHYVYNYYIETGRIPLLFKVSNATKDKMNAVVKGLAKVLEKEPHGCTILTITGETIKDTDKEQLLLVFFPFPIQTLPYIIYNNMRRGRLEFTLELLKKLEKKLDISVAYTLDFEDFKKFLAYDLQFLFKLPREAQFEAGNTLAMNQDAFFIRYGNWIMLIATTLLQDLSDEETKAVLTEMSDYTDEMREEFAKVDAPLSELYTVSNFARHVVEARFFKEITNFLERLQKID